MSENPILYVSTCNDCEEVKAAGPEFIPVSEAKAGCGARGHETWAGIYLPLMAKWVEDQLDAMGVER